MFVGKKHELLNGISQDAMQRKEEEIRCLKIDLAEANINLWSQKPETSGRSCNCMTMATVPVTKGTSPGLPLSRCSGKQG